MHDITKILLNSTDQNSTDQVSIMGPMSLYLEQLSPTDSMSQSLWPGLTTLGKTNRPNARHSICLPPFHTRRAGKFLVLVIISIGNNEVPTQTMAYTFHRAKQSRSEFYFDLTICVSLLVDQKDLGELWLIHTFINWTFLFSLICYCSL